MTRWILDDRNAWEKNIETKTYQTHFFRLKTDLRNSGTHRLGVSNIPVTLCICKAGRLSIYGQRAHQNIENAVTYCNWILFESSKQISLPVPHVFIRSGFSIQQRFTLPGSKIKLTQSINQSIDQRS